MAAVYLGTLLAILFGIQHTLGKTVSKDCGTLRYDEPAVEGRNVTLYFEPAKISTKTVGMEWLMLAGGGWKLIDNPRFRTLNFSLTVSTVQLDHRREIRAKYGACTIQIEISLIVIDQYSCGRWVKRSKEAVKLGETLEISYFPPSNIMKSTDPQYVQWITVTNSTCPAPRGCDVTNVSGVYNIRHNPITHEYVLSIVMRLDYDVTGRYRLQCTNRTTNKYTGYINVTVPAMDKNSCGLWIRKTLNDVRIGETLELSYTPTKNIMKSTDPVYVQWITVTNSTCPAPQGCDVTNVSGVYNIRHNPITHEYVLSIVMRPDYDLTGRYRLQCTNRTTDVKYTDYIYVTVPVKPDDPVLQETQTISGCDNCLIGTLGKNIQVQCRVSGGTEPLEVRINVLNQTVTPPREASGLYRAQFVMIEQMHLTDVVCSVSNLALTTPLVTDARIYVAVEPRGFQFPITEAKADMPLTFPYCTSGGARPPSSVTLHVLGLTNSTVETGHVTNVTEDDMYTTTARALSMRRAWNWQSIECCVGHITYKGPICNMHPIVYKFPPKSVNISLGYNHTELEPFYKYTVVSTIFRAWPACRAVWELPEHVIKLDEKADRNLDGPGKAYTTVAYVDLHVSRHDNEKLVTCTAKCKDFESETHAQHEINVPGLVSGQDSSLGKSSSDGDTYMLLVVVLGCCLVLAVTIIVVVIVVVVLRRRSARRKSDIQGADSGLREERQINAEGDNDSNSVADSDDNSDAHVYNAIESSKVQPSIYTGLELSSSNDVPAAGSSNASDNTNQDTGVDADVSGTVMELIPNPVRLGQHGTLVMNCYLDQSEKDTPIKTFLKVRIIRNSTREMGRNDAVTIAEAYYGNDPTTGAPIVVAELGNVTDVTSRNPTVTGDLKILMDVNTAEVRLTWDARVVVCEDMGDYQCQSIYTNFTSQVGEWTTTSVLQIHTYPSNLTMTVQRKNHIPGFAQQNTNEGQTENDPLEFDVGDIVNMQCTGSVGTDINRKIWWYRTPDFSDSPFRELFNGSSNGIWDEEPVPDEIDSCQYRRTSIVKYNMSQTDADGSRFIVFMCRIIYNSTDGTPFSLESNRKVFIQVARRAGTALPTSSVEQSSRPGHTDVTRINEWQATKKAPIHVEPTSEDRCYMGLTVGGVLVGVIVSIVVVVVVYWKRTARQGPSASAANASDNEMHVYNAIDRPTVKASDYTGLEFGTDGNEIPASKTQPEPNYENLF